MLTKDLQNCAEV